MEVLLYLSANTPPASEKVIHGKKEIPYKDAMWKDEPVFSKTSIGNANFLNQSPKLEIKNVIHKIL